MAKRLLLRSGVKISVSLILLLACSQAAIAQSSAKGFNYQAVIKDASGLLLGNQSVSLRFTLLQETTTIYAESHTSTTSPDGVINVNIGKGTAITGSFTSVDWSGQVKVKVELDKNGGNNFEELGTTTLASVPYAYYAEKTNLNLKGHGLIIEGSKITAKDSSATNEIQTLEVSGNVLRITQGNEVTLPSNTMKGHGLIIEGDKITAKDSSATNEIQTLEVNGNVLKITQGNEVTLPSSNTLTLNQSDFDAITKYKGLQILNTTDRCLYIYDTPPYYYKYCGFGCNPAPDQRMPDPILLLTTCLLSRSQETVPPLETVSGRL